MDRTLYRRTNRTTGEEKIGLWEDLCDYDVREWTRAVVVGTLEEADGRMISVPIMPVRAALCVIEVRLAPHSVFWVFRTIYHFEDLVGIRV